MKRITSIIIAGMLLASCGESTLTPTSDRSNVKKEMQSPFVTVLSTLDYNIVYDRETKVMYIRPDFRSAYASNCSFFTLMVNPDGTPKSLPGVES